MHVDPVLSLLVGALGAALVGLLGAWIQSRREHSRWIREQRMEAYRDFLRVTERLPSISNPEKYEHYFDEFRNAMATLRLLGPNSLTDAAIGHMAAATRRSQAIAHSLTEPDLADPEVRATAEQEFSETRDALVVAARKELGIRA